MFTNVELPVAQDEHPIGLLATSLSVTGVLAACGGGSDSSSGSIYKSNIKDNKTQAAAGVLLQPTQMQAARFLLQAQFSASYNEIVAVQSQGYTDWLAAQIMAPNTMTAWDWLVSQGYNGFASMNSSAFVDYMLWPQLISSNDTVRKRVALALSEFFVVSNNSVATGSRHFAMAQYWDMLVAGAFGNFRILLEEVTLNPAMGIYLNTRGNLKSNPDIGREPDENYAREVLQLFSIGVYELNLDGTNKISAGLPIETYNQDDISNLAKIFTGWDYDFSGGPITAGNPTTMRKRMIVNESKHERTSATFLGVTVPANTNGGPALKIALDTIFKHPNVPPFFSKQLIQRLVTSNPSPAYVARVASIFVDNGKGVRGDLAAVVAAILLDVEARDDSKPSNPEWGRQREPMLRFVQWARTFNATSPSERWAVYDLSDPATLLGQNPLRAPSVFNFFRPNYIPPNTALSALGLTGPEFQLTNESSTVGYLNFMMSVIRGGRNSTSGGIALPSYKAELALAANPNALIDHLNLLLRAGQLSSSTVTIIQTAITTISITAGLSNQLNRICAAIFLIMASPEYLIQK